MQLVRSAIEAELEEAEVGEVGVDVLEVGACYDKMSSNVDSVGRWILDKWYRPSIPSYLQCVYPLAVYEGSNSDENRLVRGSDDQSWLSAAGKFLFQG